MIKIRLKTPEEVGVMKEGGKRLGQIKKRLKAKLLAGVSAAEIEKEATFLIKKAGGRPSFRMVPGYRWATCVNVNEGLVHGIPKKEIVFKKGDVVSVDVGMFYQGFHTDTSLTVGIDVPQDIQKFLSVGEKALKKAIKEVKVGRRIFDISQAIEETVEKEGFSVVRDLVGHGVGRALHEAPPIPCFTQGKREKSPLITEGMTLAIEVMYAQGDSGVKKEPDGWTISMADGKISALFEETVAVTPRGNLVLTK